MHYYKMKKKILLLGGSGCLGQHIINQYKLIKSPFEIFYPNSKKLNLLNIKILKDYIVKLKPDYILHSAVYNMKIYKEIDSLNENNKSYDYRCEIRNTNIIGTCNLINIADELKIKFIYISSEYVFYGDKGSYCVSDKLNPKNIYGLTKACGEMMVKTLNNYLIIRCPFIRDITFNHKEAYNDQWCSRQYVNVVAQKLLNLDVLDKRGIIHIVGNKKTMSQIAEETNKNIKSIPMPDDFKKIIPIDSSLL